MAYGASIQGRLVRIFQEGIASLCVNISAQMAFADAPMFIL